MNYTGWLRECNLDIMDYGRLSDSSVGLMPVSRGELNKLNNSQGVTLKYDMLNG